MPNYQDGKIYELVCRVTGKRYIGSTTQRLSERLYRHKKDLDCSSKEIVENGDCYINLIRSAPCNSRDELLREERLEYDKGNCVNIKRPITTHDEYLVRMRNHNRAYYANNTDKILKQKKEAYDKKLLEISSLTLETNDGSNPIN